MSLDTKHEHNPAPMQLCEAPADGSPWRTPEEPLLQRLLDFAMDDPDAHDLRASPHLFGSFTANFVKQTAKAQVTEPLESVQTQASLPPESDVTDRKIVAADGEARIADSEPQKKVAKATPSVDNALRTMTHPAQHTEFTARLEQQIRGLPHLHIMQWPAAMFL